VNRVLRRTVPVTLVVGSMLFGTLSPAVANDLKDYLESAQQSQYAGQQATWSSYGGETQFGTVGIEHTGSMAMIERPDYSEMFGDGKYTTVGEGAGGVAISRWSVADPTNRYRTLAARADRRLGRDVTAVTVMEDRLVRARLWFDNETGALVGSEIYDGSGELYRVSWMLDFDPNPRKIFSVMGPGSTYDVVMPSADGRLPTNLAGYVNVDTYGGPDDSVHAFYTDGIFSFSVFVVEGRMDAGPFSRAKTMNVDGARYQWILTPSDLWAQWESAGTSYLLVGDLPPDHLQAVLGGLPRPGGNSFLRRIWSSIFG